MGWLTTEELWWDDKGRLRTHAPSTYKIPLASDRPKIFNVTLADWPEAHEPTIHRSKAVGEPPLHAGDLGAACAVGCRGERRRPPDLPAPRRAGDAGAGADGGRAAEGRGGANGACREHGVFCGDGLRHDLLAKSLGAFLDAAPAVAFVEVADARARRRARAAPGCWSRPTRSTAPSAAASSNTWRSTRRGQCSARGAERPGDASTSRSARRSASAAAAGSRWRSRWSTTAKREALLQAAKAEDARLPHVYIFGGGHVGHALAAALALLPVRPIVVETRPDALDGIAAPGRRRG